MRLCVGVVVPRGGGGAGEVARWGNPTGGGEGEGYPGPPEGARYYRGSDRRINRWKLIHMRIMYMHRWNGIVHIEESERNDYVRVLMEGR